MDFKNLKGIKNIINRKLCFRKKEKIGKNFSGKIIFKHRSSTFHKKKYIYLNQKNYLINLKLIFIKKIYNSFINTINGLFLYENRIVTIEKITNEINVGDILNTFQFLNKKNDSSLNFKFLIYRLTVGSFISNIEIYPGKGSQLSKAAGTYSQIINIFDFLKTYVLIYLSSKNEYLINSNCFCNFGLNNNKIYKEKKKYKAGQNRWIGKRPRVRGVAMNPIDHPHGGGQGKTSGGRCSVTPYGILTKGKKTKKFKMYKIFIKKIKEKNSKN